jgi:UPF0755 protein
VSTGVFDNEHDPQDSFFDEHDDGYADDGDDLDEHPRPRPRPGPSSAQFRRRRRFVTIGAVAFVALLALVVWLVALPIYHHFNPDDYSGSGSGSATIEVQPNDGAQAIAEALVEQGVIASTSAFLDAASADSRSATIQPGSYSLPKHISAKAALADLLDGKHQARGLVVPEGATVVDVEKRLVAPRCSAGSSAKTVCGLGVDAEAAKAALRNVGALGLPTDYTPTSGTPVSPEGFLYPLTYSVGGDTSAGDALQQMVNAFVDHVRSSGFTTAARAEHLTPYQALIIASIAQSEAYFPEDMPKVARVILNRLAAGMPLQIDATSAYAAKLAGLDPTKVIYSEVDGPYNSYKHEGLPPTPISNPGPDALAGAAHPVKGNWLYYVNADAAGHLFFTNDENAFAAAAAKCKRNNWGCG